MTTLEHFANKFGLNLRQRAPIEIPKINRKIMAETMAELGFMKGAEVGVAAGDHSELLLQTIPNLTLYCIDPWAHVDGYASFRGSTLKNWGIMAQEKLAKYEKCTILRKTSMEAVGEFPDGSFDFIYLDGAHDFRHIAEDISEWIKKVRPGGILFGHDYTRIPGGGYPCHVSDVVEAYANSHNIDTWFILGMAGKIDGLYREGERSWMYVMETV